MSLENYPETNKAIDRLAWNTCWPNLLLAAGFALMGIIINIIWLFD